MAMYLAKVICLLQQKAVAVTLNDDEGDDGDQNNLMEIDAYDARFDQALENMAICVNTKSQKAAIARQTHPHLLKK
jgi:hypothetical protein